MKCKQSCLGFEFRPLKVDFYNDNNYTKHTSSTLVSTEYSLYTVIILRMVWTIELIQCIAFMFHSVRIHLDSIIIYK